MKDIILGTVSYATLRNEDLIPSFLEELIRIDSDNNTARDIEARIEEESYYNSEDSVYDLEALFDELNNLCADIPYVYFGATEGNSSDFGYWVAWDDLIDDIQDGNLSAYQDFKDNQGEHTFVVMEDPEYPGRYQHYVSLYQGMVKQWEV